jgi:hypothetical protein
VHQHYYAPSPVNLRHAHEDADSPVSLRTAGPAQPHAHADADAEADKRQALQDAALVDAAAASAPLSPERAAFAERMQSLRARARSAEAEGHSAEAQRALHDLLALRYAWEARSTRKQQQQQQQDDPAGSDPVPEDPRLADDRARDSGSWDGVLHEATGREEPVQGIHFGRPFKRHHWHEDGYHQVSV